jgi:hypothetical protein
MVLLCELYNFQVIACILMYDLIRSLLSGVVTEMDVEILLKVLRSMCYIYLFGTLLTIDKRVEPS